LNSPIKTIEQALQTTYQRRPNNNKKRGLEKKNRASEASVDDRTSKVLQALECCMVLCMH